MSEEQRRSDRFRALEPTRCVVVEACAGSGKTWLLVSRLIRAMLAGARPGDILAITYTRKAAREIEARLRAMLASLATASDEDVMRALADRGVLSEELPASLPRARRLYEEVLHADPAMTVTTFHGWFARLISGAPMESGLAGRALEEAASSLVDEAWAMLSGRCSRDPDGELATSLLALYESIGAHSTRRLMNSFIDRRAEWRVWQEQAGGLAGAFDAIRRDFGLDAADPVEAFPSEACRRDIEELAKLLAANGSKCAGMSRSLIDALGMSDGAQRFAALREAVLTGKNEPRAVKVVKEFQKTYGPADESRLLSLFAELCERVVDVLDQCNDRATGLLNLHVFRVGEALLAEYERIKQSRRVMDFADLECEVDRLLSQEGSGAFLQARLDARYRHILLDEFQDTNPLQWRILRSWLDAYGADTSTRPQVFLVGDPKQSIYRFRRAEAKLFDAAATFFQERFDAAHITNAHTFRNAGVVVDVVNELFARTAPMAGFVEQSSQRAGWAGRCEVLPLVAANASGTANANELRNPLLEARVEEEDLRRAEEGALLARRIKEMVGSVLVRQSDGSERLARYGDVLILTRRTTYLAAYEHALRAAGIPFVSPGRGGLLETLEARDLLAVLRFLADSKDNLALAHVLRSPVFQFSNEQLLEISEAGDAWWRRLQALAANGDAAYVRAAELLRDWIAVSRHLPSHDLIDRMFDQGEWMERYRSAAPAPLWPGIHANLESLLELALNVDAGRYPSLTRFVDELSRMASVDDEAPDEGLIRATGSDQGRVRIMTIHGAKGLEAPIVWLIDAHVTPRSREGYQVLMDWPTEAMRPRQFSVIGSLRESGRVHRDVLAREDAAAAREELNLLYVAITRAEQMFLVSGVEPSRTINSGTAYSLLADAVRAIAEGESAYGEMSLGDASMPSSVLGDELIPEPRKVLKIGQRRMFAKPTEGQIFGVKLHAWLEAVTEGLSPPRVPPEVEALGKRLLKKDSLLRFFDATRYVAAGNETAFVDEKGKVGRIDRWVDCGDAIWVLDYKSGKVPDADVLQEYHEQVGRYCGVLRRIFPARVVRGMLIFTDDVEIEVA